jgi:hypothetical protein
MTTMLSRRGISSPITGAPGSSTATSKPPQATAEADSDQRPTAWRCRQVIAVPAAATAAAASSQERLASTPAMAKNPNAHTSQVVLI